MTDDPVRLLDEGGSTLLRSLLSAAREEEPEVAAVQRTLVAVGAGAALKAAAAAGASAATGAGGASASVVGSGALGTAKGAASSTLLVVVKWLAIGAVAGTVASSAVYSVGGAFAPPPVASVAPHVEVPPVRTQSPPPVATAVRDLPEIPPPPAVVVAPPSVAPPPVASAPEVDLGVPLAAEVAALDGARQALGSGDAPRTLELLSGYEARFPEARMLPEALYLRLEAFSLKGDKSSAEAVARRILRVYPSSPHAARARTVLGLDR